ncbi:multiple epidermal growth factor-like domains protein 10 [Haliotis rubra]|uniref:multiple epidermal growth factor-like domains protein 10 n=1 Tax=Haliotis rubra TaxID=36100 RepID=UPI001EE62489|nr:multiple epidermal growth factor-like domains protein 10 [Haliotis rubra]
MMVLYKLQVAALAMVLFVLLIESTSANNRHCDDGCMISTLGLSCQTCKRGCYGNRCSQRCRHCDSAGCDRETGICHRCRPGRYGAACRQRCTQCPVKSHCDRLDGTCIKTCKVGVFGVLCNHRCPRKCKRSLCRKKNGHCHLGCKPGWKGISCNSECSSNCLHKVCHDNGVCKHGCTSGFYGQLCDKKCSTLVTAECDSFTGCRSTCRQALCHPNNGSCVQGCTPGWRGSLCNERYSDLNCSSCSNETCKDGYQPGFSSHCDDGGAGGGYENGQLWRILLILGAVTTTAMMGSIAAYCTRKELRRKKQVKVAYMKVESPVYLGTVSKEVKLKQ